ncbi:MAG: hypothetical protein IKS49_00985 [Actinomycetaceae bacterium]|nr:hypothetical protein [Actinomycetaceae bacterium]
MAEHSYFAEELNAMLDQSSQSIEDIVGELNRHGFALPLRTFSYWLQGYFLPRSESAFQLVSMLEHIYGVTDNRFSDALLQDLSSGASFVPGEDVDIEVPVAPSSVDNRYSRYFGTSDKTVDWEANLIQKVVRDEVYACAGRTCDRRKTTVLARVPSAPNPTFVMQLLYEQGEVPADENFFYDVTGMTLRKQEVFDEGDMLVCANYFSLPDDVVPGDLHALSYSWDEVLQQPRERIGERLLPWALDFYSCKVTFEDGVPEYIRYATFELHGDKEVEVANDIHVIRSGNAVSMSAKNFGNLAGTFIAPSLSSPGK